MCVCVCVNHINQLQLNLVAWVVFVHKWLLHRMSWHKKLKHLVAYPQPLTWQPQKARKHAYTIAAVKQAWAVAEGSSGSSMNSVNTSTRASNANPSRNYNVGSLYKLRWSILILGQAMTYKENDATEWQYTAACCVSRADKGLHRVNWVVGCVCVAEWTRKEERTQPSGLGYSHPTLYTHHPANVESHSYPPFSDVHANKKISFHICIV